MKTLALVREPKFQTVTISTAGGAVILGSVGGAFGTAAGVVVGAGAGVVPAIFTFGLSIPAGAAIGGGLGFCAGVGTGASAGALTGATGGYCVYSYRVEIKDGVLYVRKQVTVSASRARQALLHAKDSSLTWVSETANMTKGRITEVTGKAKAKAVDLGVKAKAVATDPCFQKASASTAGGAVVLGTAGGATGVFAGAVVGLVPALFTFGLSIPACAIVGGGVGTAVGSTAGAVGGAAGYGAYHYRSEIKGYTCSKASSVQALLCSSAESMKVKATAGATQVSDSIHSLVRGATGGTEA